MDPRLKAMLQPLLEQDEVFREKDDKLKAAVQERRKQKMIGGLASDVVSAALDWYDDPSPRNRTALRKAVALLKEVA